MKLRWNFVAAGMKRSTFTGEVSFTEAEAALWGIEAAESIGHNSVIVETDSQETADLCLNIKGSKQKINFLGDF